MKSKQMAIPRMPGILLAVMLAILIPGCDGGKTKLDNIRILTGPEQGRYHEFIKSLKSRLNSPEQDDATTGKLPWELVLLKTPGSAFNLELLNRGQADFCVTQADVIADTVAKRGYKLQAVAPLFKEYVFLFRLLPKSAKPGVVKFEHFKTRSINIPDKNSGHYLTAERILKFSNVDQSNARSRDIRTAVVQELENVRQGKPGDYILAVLNKDDPLMRDLLDGRLDGRDSRDGSPVWITEGKLNPAWRIYSALNLEYLSLETPIQISPVNLFYMPWITPSCAATDMVSDAALYGKVGYPVEFVSLSDLVTESMSNLYSSYEHTRLPLHFKDTKGKTELSTLFMRAFLVSRASEKNSTVSSLLSYFAKDKLFKETITGEKGQDQPLYKNWPVSIHNGAYEALCRLKVLEDKEGKYDPFFYLLVILAMTAGAYVLTISEWVDEKRKSLDKNTQSYFVRATAVTPWIIKFLVCVALLGLAFFLAAFFIDRIETSSSITYGYESPFNQMGLFSIVLWLMLYVIGATPQTIFPSAPSSLHIIALLNLAVKIILPILAAVYFFKLIQNKSRYKHRRFSNHAVFLGWNSQYGPMIKKAVTANRKFKFVIVTNQHTESLEKLKLPSKKFSLVHGSPLEEDVLEKANLEKAKCIYIIPFPYDTGWQSRSEISANSRGTNCPKEEIYIGLAVSLKNKLNNADSEKKTGPEIFVLDSPKVIPASLLKLGIKVLNRPKEYFTMLRSLFFGNGVYSLLEYWVMQRLEKKTPKREKRPGLNMYPIFNQNQLKKISKKCKVPGKNIKNRQSPFARLLDAKDSDTFIEAYGKVREKFEQKGLILVGVAVSEKTPNFNDPTCGECLSRLSWNLFSAPQKENPEEKTSFKKHEAAILFYTAGGENYNDKRNKRIDWK